MSRLDDLPEVEKKCAVMAKYIKEDVERLYAGRKNDDATTFSSAWDGMYPSAGVDLCLHHYSWELLRTISEKELAAKLVADCARGRLIRDEAEASMQREAGKLN